MDKIISRPQITIDSNTFYYLNRREALFLYEQMPNYLTNGVALQEGSVIFDVGANIGLFTLLCYRLSNQDVKIYAFEPIPDIYEVLALNVGAIGGTNIKPYNIGLSSVERRDAPFVYVEKASGFSSMYPDQPNELKRSVKNILLTNLSKAPSFIKWIEWLPSPLRNWVLDLELTRTLKKTKTVNCQLKTISKVIEEEEIDRIDLLKIDVEKSELDVLQGINQSDWHKIKQVVIEVHDLKNRVETIKSILNRNGFDHIVVEQEPLLKKSEYFNVYATRL